MGEPLQYLGERDVCNANVDCRGFLDCATIPETASTMASLGTRSGSFVGSGNGLGMMQRSMSANGIASVANRAHLYQGVGPCMSADGVNEWLLQSKRGDSQSRVHAGEEVVSASNGHRSAAQQPAVSLELQRHMDSLEKRLRSEMRSMRERADRQVLDLEQKLSSIGDDVQMQVRKVNLLEERLLQPQAGTEAGFAIEAAIARFRGLEEDTDDLNGRVKQTGLALTNFHERINALEGKMMQPDQSRKGATNTVPPHQIATLLGEQHVGSQSTRQETAFKDLRDIRAGLLAQNQHLERERCERLAGMEEIRQAVSVSNGKTDISEHLEALTRRLNFQERAHEELREMHEHFFTDARSVLTSAAPSAGPSPKAGSPRLVQGETRVLAAGTTAPFPSRSRSETSLLGATAIRPQRPAATRAPQAVSKEAPKQDCFSPMLRPGR